jgi:hypothetical protein
MIPISGTHSRAGRVALGAGGALLASAVVALPALPSMGAEPPAPGHEIISFPQRDFVSASGYVQGVEAYVQVIRGGVPIAISTPVLPEDDPGTAGFDGLVEVNHPGGGCWSTATGTPDIQPGDKVRVFQEQDDPTTAGVVDVIPIADDTTTTAAVTAGRPVVSAPDINNRVTVTVKGTAQTLTAAGTPTGTPIPLAQIEQRLINGDKFSFNGRRDLRAPRDGTLRYDAAGGIDWTATYTRIPAADVKKINASESRVLWLGPNALTIYENGSDVVAGPEAPCTAPLQGAPAPAPAAKPAQALLPDATSVSAPVAPHSLIAFPSRDFISADGYTPGSTVSFSVLRGGTLVGQSDSVVVDDAGVAEVNHPGGGCFLSTTQTPDIRVGDVVRITDLTSHVAEQTTVADVTVDKPTSPAANTVRVTGTAFNADGSPMALGQVEQRFVNTQRFASGRRTLRAPGQGTLVAGATPGSWVATYTGLVSTDVTKALKGETRAMWLGPDPAAGTELTIYELPDTLSGVLNGVVGGPMSPCTAAAEIG